MEHIDITFDLETCATSANAAVMQVAAVAWNRAAEANPFFISHSGNVSSISSDALAFNEHIDLRSCVVDGFDFDKDTLDWWANQKPEAKQAVCADLPEPIEEVFLRFVRWLEDVQKATGAKSICLWCQGMDFDGAILRNICHKYDIQLPFSHRQFRDCRTVIIEAAVHWLTKHQPVIKNGEEVTWLGILQKPCLAYEFYRPLPDGIIDASVPHDALYDSILSSWSTWQALNEF